MSAVYIDQNLPVDGSSCKMAITARRTEPLDANLIMALVTTETERVFGRTNLLHLIEKANLAVSLVDHHNALLGHACFFDYSMQSGDYGSMMKLDIDWLCFHFDIADCNSINTLFLNYFVSKEDISEAALTEILRSVFNAVPYLHFILIVLDSQLDLAGTAMSKLFVSAARLAEDATAFNVFMCARHNFCPVLHVREARVEDHDDLMPVFNLQSKFLTEVYGEFFLAEMIEAQDESHRCIVADVDGKAVGFMSLTTVVNSELLKTCFELDVFNNLSQKALSKEVHYVSIGNDHAAKSLKNNLRQQTIDAQKLDKPFIEVGSAVCIQLFCIDEKYETRSLDLLSKVFELFPEKEFVIITVPHAIPEFPLVQNFQRASPKRTSTLPQELYIFSKHGLLNCMKIRHCNKNDIEGIRDLSRNIVGMEHLLNDVERYISYQKDEDGTVIHAFVAIIKKQVVGVSVLRREENIDCLRARYNIEDFVYFSLHEKEEHGHMYHYVLNPIFQHYSKYYLKEIMRLSNMSCIYYPVYAPYVYKNSKPHSLITCLKDFIPVRPRKQILYPLDHLEANAPAGHLVAEQELFALYHLNRKLTFEPKVVNNVRIVVVGASDVGLSLCETLVFCPHLCFNNLTLVTANDIPGAVPHKEISEWFLPSSLSYSHREHILMSLRTWVNVIVGKMTAIDREKKLLTIDGGRYVPYDELILCTGMQYYPSVATGADIGQLLTTSEALKNPLPMVYKGSLPPGVFTVNTVDDCLAVEVWVREMFLKTSGYAVVYGSTLDAYTCLNGLLKLGIPGSRLVLVHPPSSSPSCFNNPHVEDVMKMVLLEKGISVHRGFTLARWNDGEVHLPLKCCSFTSDAKPLKLACQGFFCCDKKSVNYDSFRAINNSCLVFDGKLVVDSEFRTNDASIRAAGPLTKYARRYHANNWSHANFCSREIGQRLAESLLHIFDPTLVGTQCKYQHHPAALAPVYKKAKSIYAQLPGDLYFFHVGKPSLASALEASILQPDYGQALITGNALARDEPDYFRLHVNQYRSVETITCLSKKAIKADNFRSLYGIHERCLNNLLQRFREGLIKDFYSYFEESWCLAIFHDRFPTFSAEVRDLLCASESSGSLTIEERARRLLLEDLTLTPSQRSQLAEYFVGSGCKKDVEERLICFLNYNQYHLPMYARPGML